MLSALFEQQKFAKRPWLNLTPKPWPPQIRVVSMPCWELFEDQDASYKQSILPPAVTARVSIEAGATFGWKQYVGDRGHCIGVDTFGASAPGPLLYEKFGISAQVLSNPKNPRRFGWYESLTLPCRSLYTLLYVRLGINDTPWSLLRHIPDSEKLEI